ncbi:MAG: S-layer homology domain-containing protein [Clostridia bacterium]|nr:S-layer homology domain-containing protein [Clostridia bacterium]
MKKRFICKPMVFLLVVMMIFSSMPLSFAVIDERTITFHGVNDEMIPMVYYEKSENISEIVFAKDSDSGENIVINYFKVNNQVVSSTDDLSLGTNVVEAVFRADYNFPPQTFEIEKGYNHALISEVNEQYLKTNLIRPYQVGMVLCYYFNDSGQKTTEGITYYLIENENEILLETTETLDYGVHHLVARKDDQALEIELLVKNHVPSIVPKNERLILALNGTVALDYDVMGKDVEDGVLPVTVLAPYAQGFNTSSVSTYPITYSVTDLYGDTTTREHTVDVRDIKDGVYEVKPQVVSKFDALKGAQEEAYYFTYNGFNTSIKGEATVSIPEKVSSKIVDAAMSKTGSLYFLVYEESKMGQQYNLYLSTDLTTPVISSENNYRYDFDVLNWLWHLEYTGETTSLYKHETLIGTFDGKVIDFVTGQYTNEFYLLLEEGGQTHLQKYVVGDTLNKVQDFSFSLSLGDFHLVAVNDGVGIFDNNGNATYMLWFDESLNPVGNFVKSDDGPVYAFTSDRIPEATLGYMQTESEVPSFVPFTEAYVLNIGDEIPQESGQLVVYMKLPTGEIVEVTSLEESKGLVELSESQVTAVKRGETQVTASYNNLKASFDLVVNEYRNIAYEKQDTHLNEAGDIAFYGNFENQIGFLIRSYFVNSLLDGFFTYPPNSISLINGEEENHLTSTVGLLPGLYHAVGHTSIRSDDYLFLTDPTYAFDFEVLNNPPEIQFYGDLLSVIKNAPNAYYGLGVTSTDLEEDLHEVVLTKSNNLVSGDYIVSDTILQGLLTFDTIDENDASFNNPKDREVEVVEFKPENGIVSIAENMMVLQDFTRNQTTFIEALEDENHKFLDFAVSAKGRQSILVEENREDFTAYYIYDGLPINSESKSLLDGDNLNVFSIAYDSYGNLYYLNFYYDEEEQYHLGFYRIDFNDASNEVISTRLMNLDEIFFQSDVTNIDVKDFAFGPDNTLYMLYGQKEDLVNFYLSIQMTENSDGLSIGDYTHVHIGRTLPGVNPTSDFSGIAVYDNQVYVAKNDHVMYPEAGHFLDEKTLLVPVDENLSPLWVDAYFGNAVSLGNTFKTEINCPDVIELEVGFNSLKHSDILEVSATPYVFNSEIAYLWEENDVFAFNEETKEVSALSEGQGVITLQVNGISKQVMVKVVEKPLITDIKPLIIEKNGMVQGNAGIMVNSPYPVELYVLDQEELIPAARYIFKSDQTGSYTVTYSAVSEDKTQTFERTVTVIESNLNDVSILLENTERRFVEDESAVNEFWQGEKEHNYLSFYNHVTGVTSLLGDVSYLPMLFDIDLRYPVITVATDTNDNIFLFLGEILFSVNPKTGEKYLWQWGEGLRASQMIDYRNMGMAFDENNTLMIALNDSIYTFDLDYDNHTFIPNQEFESMENIFINDIYVTEDHRIFILRTAHHNIDKASSGPSEGSIVIEEVKLMDSTIEVIKSLSIPLEEDCVGTGLMAYGNHLYMTLDGSVESQVVSVDFDLTESQVMMMDFGPYMPHITDGASRWRTTLQTEGITLHIGYNQGPSAGEKVIPYVLTPEFRKGLPVTFEMVSGSDVISLNQETGLIKGKKAGYAKVKVTVDGVSSYTNVTVVTHDAPITNSVGITLSPNPVEVEYGPGADPELLTKQVKATVYGTSSPVTYKMANASIATVDENGLVTAVSTGETTLTATVAGRSTSVKVIVYYIDEELNPLGLVEFNLPYVSGYPDGTFRPNEGITRAELATMFTRILNLEIAPNTERFPDVHTDHWAFGYIDAATRAGIFSGYNDGLFRPDQIVTRAELSATVAKYWQYFEVDVDHTPQMIKDVTPTFWAKDYIYMIYNAGLVKNFEDGTFKPNDPTLRSQIVSILNILINRNGLDQGSPNFSDVPASHPNYMDIEAASNSSVKKSEE